MNSNEIIESLFRDGLIDENEYKTLKQSIKHGACSYADFRPAGWVASSVADVRCGDCFYLQCERSIDFLSGVPGEMRERLIAMSVGVLRWP